MVIFGAQTSPLCDVTQVLQKAESILAAKRLALWFRSLVSPINARYSLSRKHLFRNKQKPAFCS